VVFLQLRVQIPCACRQLFQTHFVHDALAAIAVVRALCVPTVTFESVGLIGAGYRRAHIPRLNAGRVLQPFFFIGLCQYVYIILHFHISFQYK
jgi:hypothetical protein